MKSIFSIVLCVSTLVFADIPDEIASRLVRRQDDGKVYVNGAVGALLRNDGLFPEEQTEITLSEAVQATQRTWFNKAWQHAATEEDRAKKQRIALGSSLLRSLHRAAINPDEKADLVIAHGGVLPSALKMFLAVQVAYEQQGARKLVVVNGSEDFNLKMIRKAAVQDYKTAAKILGSAYQFPEITDANKPENGKQVAQFAYEGFKAHLPGLTVEYIDKKDLPAYTQSLAQPTRATVAASYPQLEAHLLTFAALGNDNFKVVAGVTNSACDDELEVLYDAQTPEEKYNFERNNFARVLNRIAEHLKV